MSRNRVQLDAAIVCAEIDRLMVEFPELVEDDDFRRDVIEGQTDAMEILERLAAEIAENASFAKAIQERGKEILGRAARYERREDAYRSMAQRIMQAAEIRKAELEAATLSLRAVPPSVRIVNENDLPEWAWRIKREVSKSEIKDRLKAGETVPGAELTNGSETLSVRV